MDNEQTTDTQQDQTNDAQQTETQTDNQTEANQFEGNPEFDKALGRAVDKALKNNDKKWEAKIEAAKQQATSYAKMTKDQQKEADLKAREQQLAAREQELNQKQLLNEVTADLSSKGLPTSFAKALIQLGDNDTISQAVSDIKTAWDDSVAEQLKASARQSTPSESSASFTNGNTASDIAKMAAEARIIEK